MLSDPNVKWAKETGFDLDLSSMGIGHRVTRFGMIIKNGQVVYAQKEDNPGVCFPPDPENEVDGTDTPFRLSLPSLAQRTCLASCKASRHRDVCRLVLIYTIIDEVSFICQDILDRRARSTSRPNPS